MLRFRSNLLLLLLASALALATVSVSASELCQFTQGKIATFQEAHDCFQSVPFNESVRAQTIDTLRKVMQLYVFLDIANKSPAPQLPVSVDILSELDRISRQFYANDFQFQDDLRTQYLRFFDAHTQYYGPVCYSNLQLAQPLGPIAYVENGEIVFDISNYFQSDLVEYFKTAHGYDVTQFAGARILSIEQSSPLAYFKAYAQSDVGIAKDPITRLHITQTMPQPTPDVPARQVMASYWQIRTHRNPFPSSSFVSYELLLKNGSSTTVHIPWVARVLKSYANRDAFLADYWAAGSSSRRSAAQLRTPVSALLGSGVEEKMTPLEDILVVEQNPAERKRDSARFTLLVGSADVSFYLLDDSNTMVMYLNTMAPTNYLDTYETMNKAFKMAEQNNYDQLIIDLTNNGGGNICFGRMLLAYFQGRFSGVPNWGPQDLPLSDLQSLLTETAVQRNVSGTVWSPGFYSLENGQRNPNWNISAIQPGIEHTRGGRRRNYSELLHIRGCGNLGYVLQPAKQYTKDQVVLLSRGFCGSTCALFNNHATLYDQVRTAVFGLNTQPDATQQPTAFPGLQVLDDPDIYAMFQHLGFDTSPQPVNSTDPIPRELPTTASYRMCVREIYGPVNPEQSYPLEYTYMPATKTFAEQASTAN
eukprot:CAMPEP_0174230054 /NCGR_PEP_ID=MMETSP0417-20130205/888_1 /TAXON_ID=242541 /ORGANISM="Mayorella sp, Strain BSH-02190019" /LENGTH=645 /DNA_ID=CAMNT_0015307679 /DNA_START=152 /DNA_END=2086 /DNA_ORIENTATION=-